MSREIVSLIGLENGKVVNVVAKELHIAEVKRVLRFYSVELCNKDGLFAVIDNAYDYEDIKFVLKI